MQMPLLARLAIVFASGCGVFATETRTTVTFPLRIQGIVSSSLDGAVIEGATVTLGVGGITNAPSVRQTDQTDAVGAYTIQDVLTVDNTCPFIWVRAEAAGYVTSSTGDSSFSVLCTGLAQSINITLQPAP